MLLNNPEQNNNEFMWEIAISFVVVSVSSRIKKKITHNATWKNVEKMSIKDFLSSFIIVSLIVVCHIHALQMGINQQRC